MVRVPIEATTPRTVTFDGHEVLHFGGTNYLGLAHHPEVLAAAKDTLDSTGLSSSGSRETTGNHIAHERLEEALAEFVGTESALLTTDGYLADLAALQSLANTTSVAVIDADAHPSLFDAARATGVETYDYGGGDLNRAYALIDRHRERGLSVLTDGAFPLQGRLAAMSDLLRVLPRDGALVVDDSHGIGVLGERGRGILEAFGVENDPRVVLTASLAKALGCAGGVVAGSAERIARLRTSADAYIGATPIPAAIAAAAYAALRVIEDEPARVERLHAITAQLHHAARRLGLRARGTFLPVLTIPAESWESGERIHDALLHEGLFVPFIRYPGAADVGVFRIAVTSEHTSADVRRLEDALEEHVGAGR